MPELLAYFLSSPDIMPKAAYYPAFCLVGGFWVLRMARLFFSFFHERTEALADTLDMPD